MLAFFFFYWKEVICEPPKDPIEILIQQMYRLAEELIQSANFDRTEQGRVTRIVNNNHYHISMERVEFIVPCGVNIPLAVGDRVWVTIPQNHSKDKFISGKVIP